MKTTYQELIDFVNAGSNYLVQFKEPSKLGYAVSRMQKRAKPLLTKFDEAMEDQRMDRCLEDEKTKAVLRGANSELQFTKAALKELNTFRRDFLTQEVEVEPYFATSVPADLPSDFRVAFEGFVLNPNDAPE